MSITNLRDLAPRNQRRCPVVPDLHLSKKKRTRRGVGAIASLSPSLVTKISISEHCLAHQLFGAYFERHLLPFLTLSFVSSAALVAGRSVPHRANSWLLTFTQGITVSGKHSIPNRPPLSPSATDPYPLSKRRRISRLSTTSRNSYLLSPSPRSSRAARPPARAHPLRLPQMAQTPVPLHLGPPPHHHHDHSLRYLPRPLLDIWSLLSLD